MVGDKEMQKFLKKNKKSLPASRQGLTLVETVVAIAILSITILASTAVSSSYLRSRMSIKKYQANNEELSLALNYLSKDIRMSGGFSGGSYGSPILSMTLVNNAGEGSIFYEFTGSELKRNGAVVASNVTGAFYVLGDATTIPRVTIRIQKETVGISPVSVQTTVSMRTKYKDGP